MKTLLSGALLFVSICVEAQLLSGEEMMKLVPDKITGYRRSEEPRTHQLQIGTLSYSICQKGFSSGSKQITILLFDFKNAPIMYSQVTREWSKYQAVDSDSLLLRPIIESNYFGWESNNIGSRSSKIFLGISNRFYMAIDGRNIVLDDLRAILNLFSLEIFPE
jgi:hypothetical protein